MNLNTAETEKKIRKQAINNDAVVNPLREQVRDAMQNYFQHLNGYPAADLYQMVLSEVEPPLLETVMEYTRGNQSRAAEVLGISRSTLRKKLATYGLNK